MKYTNTFEELIEHLNALMEEYLERKSLTENEERRSIERYEEEKEFLRHQVERFPEALSEMWFLTFLGNYAAGRKVVVRNQMNQCPFLMYLLKVASYNVFDEGYGKEKYLYEKSNIDATHFYVGENFYKKVKYAVEDFFEQTGHIVKWVGYSDVGSFYHEERKVEGLIVFPRGTKAKEYKSYCGKLYDETECILSEYAPELYDKGTWYQFISIQQEKKMMSTEERSIMKAYQKQDIGKEHALKVLASSLIDGFFKPAAAYYDAMELFQDNIYSREDLYKYLLKAGMSKERAYFWTEIIRKGTLGWRIKEQKLSYENYVELYYALGKERIDMFCEVKYLPTRWSVLERFYRLQEQGKANEVIAVDFDGTLSLGEWPDIGPANEELIEFLKERKKSGDKLILWTCREGEALEAAVQWCMKKGLLFDAINDNLPEVIQLYGTNSRKVTCDYYIDDRAVWTNAFELLK